MSKAFEKIISFESLYKAHIKARLSKRHKDEVIKFENDLSNNLWSLHFELKYNKYKTGGYHMFKINDPKERIIQAITYRDRIVQRSLCDNYLTPLLEKHLIYDNVACRRNKGTLFAFKRLTKFMSEHYKKHRNTGYFVKLDVTKYFDSIDHTILKSLLSKLIKENDVLNLINIIIDSHNFEINKGLPLGNQSSQAFALLYLDSFDRYFKEKLRVKYYIRYMDDIIMLVDDKDMAKTIIKKSIKILEKKNLKLNPKSQIISAKSGVQFLGWNFKFGLSGKIFKTLSAQTKHRIFNKLMLRNSLIKKECAMSYIGFLKFGNEFYLINKIKNKMIRN